MDCNASSPNETPISLDGPAPSARTSLVRLILAAGASIDSDCNRARDYLTKAAAMLSASEPSPAETGKAPFYRGGLAAWQAKRIVAHIDTHLNAKIHACDLAQLVGLSTSHFFRAFRESFGDPPMLFVAKRRMRVAQELMLRSRDPLSQIALACGLCDQAHFTRVFRRVVGQTPRIWRRQFARDPGLSPAPASGERVSDFGMAERMHHLSTRSPSTIQMA